MKKHFILLFFFFLGIPLGHAGTLNNANGRNGLEGNLVPADTQEEDPAQKQFSGIPLETVFGGENTVTTLTLGNSYRDADPEQTVHVFDGR